MAASKAPESSGPQVGIESIGLYVPRNMLSLKCLAEARGVPAKKYLEGIGQEWMAVPAPDEDVVSMGANAARQALQRIDVSSIDTLIFATETGIDQSKSAGIYVHSLLNLPKRCRTFEVKQACCSSTAALQMALATVALKPQRRVLIIASDIARYGLESAGEPTQGAGAIALVVSATPRLLSIQPEAGHYTDDVMDFWRPNYLDEALVDGKYSIKVYMQALHESWKSYAEESGLGIEDFDRFCYHLPFTRMAHKAHTQLLRSTRSKVDAAQFARQTDGALHYNRIIGNCYTASLYIGLLSLLEQAPEDLSGQRVGFFSYGSGCMGSFFGGIVQPGYQDALFRDAHAHLLRERRELTLEEYESFYQHRIPADGSDFNNPRHDTGAFRFAGISGHKRLYESVLQAVPAVTRPAERPEKHSSPRPGTRIAASA